MRGDWRLYSYTYLSLLIKPFDKEDGKWERSISSANLINPDKTREIMEERKQKETYKRKENETCKTQTLLPPKPKQPWNKKNTQLLS